MPNNLSIPRQGVRPEHIPTAHIGDLITAATPDGERRARVTGYMAGGFWVRPVQLTDRGTLRMAEGEIHVLDGEITAVVRRARP